MLLAALALTILGFVALVVSVATGTIAFAWVCIVAGICGFVLLIWDSVRTFVRRRRAAQAPASPGGGARGGGDGFAHPGGGHPGAGDHDGGDFRDLGGFDGVRGRTE